MKITLNAKKFSKPLEAPQMLLKHKINEEPEEKGLVITDGITYSKSKEKKEAEAKEIRDSFLPIIYKPNETSSSDKANKGLIGGNFKFGLAATRTKTHRISAVPSTKNDKTHLLIESFAEGHMEAIDMFNKVKFDKDGLYIPEQNKFFFEYVITNSSFEQYITTNEEATELTMQQVEYCFFKSPVVEQDKCIYKDVDLDKIAAYEYKFKHTPALGLSFDNRSTEKPLKDLLELSKLLKKGEKVYIQFGFIPAEKDWHKSGAAALKDLPKRIKQSDQKLAYSAFESCLRVMCLGSDKNRSDVIFRGFNIALKQLNGENELIEQKIKDKKLKKWMDQYVLPRKIVTYLSFNKRFLWCHKEISHLVKLPQRQLQTEYEIKVNEREQNTIPKILRGKGILMGHSEEKNKSIPISIPVNNKDFLCGTYAFIGSPRMGKDYSCSRFIIEAVKLGHGAVIPDAIDEQGRGMADLIKQNVPNDRVIDVDFTDINHSIYFGLDDIIDLVGLQGVDLVANDLVKLLDLEDKYDSKQLARLVARATKCNIYDMYRFLKSEKYAKKVYENLKKEDKLLAFQIKTDYFDKKPASNIIGAVLVRLDELLGFKLIKNMFAQKPNRKFDLEKLMNQNKVIIIRMKKAGGLGEMGVRTLMSLLTLKIFWIKKIKQTDNVTFLSFNEFHQYSSKSFEETLSDMCFEAPKYRLGVCLVFHSPERIGRFIWDSIQTSPISYFLFKNNNIGIYRHMADQLKPFDIEVCMGTQKWESIYLPFVGKSLSPVFLKMSPVDVVDKAYNSEKDTDKYGTSINEISDYIYQCEVEMFEDDEPEEQPKKKRR